jgi:putative PIN family toxin of toxin-antitoxin system
MGDMKPLRVVLDTNVLVAALRSGSGASRQILLALRDERFSALVSVPLFMEYEATLKRAALLRETKLSLRDIDELLDIVAACCEQTDIHFSWRPQLRDPKDEMVLETALNSRADALVTFKRTDFEAACANFSVELLSPSQFLDRLRKRS